MCSRNQGDCCGCAETTKLTQLDLEKSLEKYIGEEPEVLATVQRYGLHPSSRGICGSIFRQVHDMITLNVLEIPSFCCADYRLEVLKTE